MRAFKIIKNLALLFMVVAVPSLLWAGGFVVSSSWSSFFLLTSISFFILWIRTKNTLNILENLFSVRKEEWAICEKGHIIEKSGSFPIENLRNLKDIIHTSSIVEVHDFLSSLFTKKIPFKVQFLSPIDQGSYTLTGISMGDQDVLFVKREMVDEKAQKEISKRNQEIIKRLQKTLERLPLFIWHRDEKQRITYCNMKYANALGVSQGKIYDESLELIQARSAKSLARKALNSQNLHWGDGVAFIDNKRIPLRLCEVPDGIGRGTLGVAYDILELQEAREELRNLSKAHNAVLDHLGTAIAVYDAEGILNYYNKAYLKLHAFREDFLSSKPRFDEVVEELRNRRQLPEHADFLSYKKECLRQFKDQDFIQDDLLHLPDERSIRVLSVPYPTGGKIFIYDDMTTRFDLERKNKILNDLYYTALDHLFEGILILGSDNRLKHFNPSFLELWNLDQGSLIKGEHISDLLERIKNLLDYDSKEIWDTYKANLIGAFTDRLAKTRILSRKGGKKIEFCYIPLPNGDHMVAYRNTSVTAPKIKKKAGLKIKSAKKLKTGN